MGKVFCKNISKLTFCVLLTCILISGGRAHASYREFQLFDRAYLSYLSYQPENAVKEFRLFLDEFPNSSAKDAALFWLAKSLLQIKSVEEAKKTFADIKEQFPESPFNRYVTKEIETIGNATDEHGSVKGTVDAETVQKPADEEKPVLPGEISHQQALDCSDMQIEAERLQGLFDEEMAKNNVLQRRLWELEQREKYIINSSFVLDRIGIHDVLWRTNNIVEDIENEHILYEQATSLNITADSSQQRELIGMYKLNKEQADYLNRYLVICEFLTTKMNDIAYERIVESLTVNFKTVRYKEDGTFDTLTLASELQTYARNGMSLEDIHALYPDLTKFASVRVQDLKGGMKEKISYFQNDETGVFWTEDAFMIVRLISQNTLPCNPVEYKQSQDKNKIRMFITELVGERKREGNAVKIQEGK
jgi:hypothetical protein